MILSRKPLGVSRLQDKSLCSYGSQACAMVSVCVSMLPLKWQRAFCSGCFWRSAQVPCPAGASIPHLLSMLAADDSQLRPSTGNLPPHPHTSACSANTGQAMTGWLWCNSCSRAPHGIRLKPISIETIPIFSCPTPSLLPLGAMPP